ncbi:MAG: ABC transporter ATP-binding protein [Neptuniibacter sp.]
MEIIQVSDLSKSFKLYDRPSDRLKEVVLRRTYHHSFKALDKISITLNAGETLGVLGKNGAGKSTLLKILTGVLLPDAGSVSIRGKVTGLLELGTGFDTALSGYENIFSNGLLIGMQKNEIETQLQDIIDFSELGEFINEPLRTYSSGMVMRLAFAIAIHASPNAFLVDEALSVGDGHFQQKCMRKIREFREQGGAIIFVSHDLNAVKLLCDRAVVLDQGIVACAGSPEEAVNYYNRIMAEMDEHDMPSGHQAHSYGDLKAEIKSAKLVGQDSGSELVSSGENATIELDLVGHKQVINLSAGILIRDRFGQDVFGTNTHLLGQVLNLQEGQSLKVKFVLPMDIAPGKYTITTALHSEDNHLDECYHWCDNLIRFEVAGIKGSLFSGICRLHPELEIEEV